MLSTSSQTSNRAIIAYLCLHHSHATLKSPPELLWESRQTFQNCANLSSTLPWWFCSETEKMNQGARAFQSSWLQRSAINHRQNEVHCHFSTVSLGAVGICSGTGQGTVLLLLGSALYSSHLLSICTDFCSPEESSQSPADILLESLPLQGEPEDGSSVPG